MRRLVAVVCFVSLPLAAAATTACQWDAEPQDGSRELFLIVQPGGGNQGTVPNASSVVNIQAGVPRSVSSLALFPYAPNDGTTVILAEARLAVHTVASSFNGLDSILHDSPRASDCLQVAVGGISIVPIVVSVDPQAPAGTASAVFVDLVARTPSTDNGDGAMLDDASDAGATARDGESAYCPGFRVLASAVLQLGGPATSPDGATRAADADAGADGDAAVDGGDS
jgi:hypothetical protein